MKKWAWWILGTVLGLGVLMGTGCKPAARDASGDGADKIRLAFLTNNAANFWTIARRGCEEAERSLGNVKVEFRIPSDGSAAEQTRILNDLLAMGLDGIAISPVDPDNQTDLLNDAAAKTLLITHDSDAPTSNRACYIGTDNIAAGRQAGEAIKACLPDGGKIMVFVGKKDAQNARERFQGIQEALAGSSVEIIDIRTDDTDTVRAKSNAADTLLKYPDISGLVGLWNYNGPAILNAVQDAGKAGQVKIVCFDEEEETLTGVQEGVIYATVVQQPYEFGKQAITRMATYLAGDASVFPESKIHIVPTKLITADNVEAFAAELKDMLAE